MPKSKRKSVDVEALARNIEAANASKRRAAATSASHASPGPHDVTSSEQLSISDDDEHDTTKSDARHMGKEHNGGVGSSSYDVQCPRLYDVGRDVPVLGVLTQIRLASSGTNSWCHGP
jgi:hypothetical protein